MRRSEKSAAVIVVAHGVRDETFTKYISKPNAVLREIKLFFTSSRLYNKPQKNTHWDFFTA